MEGSLSDCWWGNGQREIKGVIVRGVRIAIILSRKVHLSWKREDQCVQ